MLAGQVPVSGTRVGGIWGGSRRGHCVDGPGQREDLAGKAQQLPVLPLLGLDLPPLTVGQDLAFLAGPVLADHHQGGQGDGLKQHDHRE
jgi:hypothetical protein